VADVEADTEIQNDIMECSLTFAAVLIEHSLAVFDLMERDEVLENAQKILEWIRKSQNLKFTFGIASVLCNGVSKRWTKSTRLSENWKNMVTSAVLRTNQSHIVRAPCSK